MIFFSTEGSSHCMHLSCERSASFQPGYEALQTALWHDKDRHQLCPGPAAILLFCLEVPLFGRSSSWNVCQLWRFVELQLCPLFLQILTMEGLRSAWLHHAWPSTEPSASCFNCSCETALSACLAAVMLCGADTLCLGAGRMHGLGGPLPGPIPVVRLSYIWTLTVPGLVHLAWPHLKNGGLTVAAISCSCHL